MFLIIFTFVYIIFFIIYDKLSNKHLKKTKHKFSLAQISSLGYTNFSSFYGLTNINISTETLVNIFNYISNNNLQKISDISKMFNIDNYSSLIIYLYLEYLSLVPKKIFDYEKDSIIIPSKNDEILMNKYIYYFYSKSTYEDISKTMGPGVSNDLIYLQNKYLIPGVIYKDSNIYYVGDINEKR